MAENESPNRNKWPEIIMAWVGMAGVTALLFWWLGE